MHLPLRGALGPLTMPPKPPTTLLGGLVSYWKLDEASGQRNDSVGTNHLADHNTVTQAVGKIAFAAQFTPASLNYLDVADNATLDFTTAFSIAVWVFPDAVTGNKFLATKWGSSQNTWILDTSGRKVRLFIASSLTDSSNLVATVNDVLTLSTWAHVVAVYDGTLAATDRVKLYIDGGGQSVTITGTIAASLTNSTSPLRIGTLSAGAGFWAGREDEMALYGRALTQAEVSELYNGGTGRTYPFS